VVFIYFSGTGNSKHIAKMFCRNMNVPCHSIEDEIDFTQLIESVEVIGFCYPIYGSRLPRIMREFIERHKQALEHKKLIIFCTQMIPLGDGTRNFTKYLRPTSAKVIYAERFLMPNNINNVIFFPLYNDKAIKKSLTNAEKKMKKVCENIKKDRTVRRGFDPVSIMLGSLQGAMLPLIEKIGRKRVWINGDCSKCGLCISTCPMKNFANYNGTITTQNNCTLCFRCINKCPKKAISILRRGKVKKQYKGI